MKNLRKRLIILISTIFICVGVSVKISYNRHWNQLYIISVLTGVSNSTDAEYDLCMHVVLEYKWMWHDPFWHRDGIHMNNEKVFNAVKQYLISTSI